MAILLIGLVEELECQIEGAPNNLVCGEAPILSERDGPTGTSSERYISMKNGVTTSNFQNQGRSETYVLGTS
jgi:hypothetical protein